MHVTDWSKLQDRQVVIETLDGGRMTGKVVKVEQRHVKMSFEGDGAETAHRSFGGALAALVPHSLRLTRSGTTPQGDPIEVDSIVAITIVDDGP